MVTFEIIVGLNPVGKYESFNEAFKKFYSEIVKVLEAGTSLQWLETSNFFVRTGGTGPIGVMDFYDARDLAYETGLLAGKGEIQLEAVEPDPEVVAQAFQDCADRREEGELRQLEVMVEQMLKLVGQL